MSVDFYFGDEDAKLIDTTCLGGGVGIYATENIAIGGAALTAEYAREIGADSFAREETATLQLFQQLDAPAGVKTAGGDGCASRP